jgi:hypothetical protein
MIRYIRKNKQLNQFETKWTKKEKETL